MVSHLNFRWNTIKPSLYLLYDKMVDLGFRDENGEVYITDEFEEYYVKKYFPDNK